MKETYVNVDGERLYFFVEKKPIKNINLKVNINKTVTISIPRRMSVARAKEFVSRKSDWIKKQQDYFDSFTIQTKKTEVEDGDDIFILGKQYTVRVFEHDSNRGVLNGNYLDLFIKSDYVDNYEYVNRYFDLWIRNFAKTKIYELVFKYQIMTRDYGISMPKIEIRQMKSRWGSCMPTRQKVIFNLSLIKAPIYCIEYVVLHELTHLKYPNHSKEFYSFVQYFMPDWYERKRILDQKFTGVI
jgi:predicted metal-dependent hydrolase